MMSDKAGFDALMHDVCVGWGYCGGVVDGEPLHVTMFIPETGIVSADQFVDWVFRADGMDPAAEPGRWQPHKDAIKAAFIKHMGGEAVDARTLRWSAC